MLLWLAAAAAGTCERAVPVSGFRADLDAAWDLAVDGRSDRFRTWMTELQAALPCLDGPLTPADAAAFHRNRAVFAEVAGDPVAAGQAAGAAAHLAPDAIGAWGERLPAFAKLLVDAPRPGPVEEFSAALAARVFSDGAPGAIRRRGHPTLVQVFAADGVTSTGAWIDARASIPVDVVYPEMPCAERVPVDALLRAVDEADQAFVALDVPRFEASLQTVAAGLPCVDSAIRPAQAAAIHRLEGLRLHAYGATLGALRAFQESRQLDPSYVPPPEVVRPGSSLETTWLDAGRLPSPPWLAVDLPAGLVLRVDGVRAAERPATLPSIVQASTPTGEILLTQYVPADAPFPSLDRVASVARMEREDAVPPAVRIYTAWEERQRQVRSRQGMLLSGISMLTASGVLYTLHARSLDTYKDPFTRADRLDPARQAANVYATATTISGVVGLGLVGFSLSLPTERMKKAE